jgi:hypothetical protein
MSVTNYLDYFNKGKRSVLTEAINLPSSKTGIPKLIQGVEQKQGSINTMQRGKLDLPIVDIDSLKNTLIEYSGARGTGLNQTICVLGDPGMGKSAIVLDSAKKICDAFNNKYREKRTFVQFTGTDRELLKAIFKNPENYYVFIDVRMTAYEKYELKGTPFPSKEEELEGTMRSAYDDWMATLFLPKAAGMLFLDEINQADIGTQTALYGLLHKDERTIGGRGIANKDRWSVHCAGNLPEDAKGVTSLLAALQDRVGGTVWLEVTYPKWIEWAKTATTTNQSGELKSTFHPLVLGFLSQNYDVLEPDEFKKMFIKQDVQGKLNSPNPRNFVALSEALYSYDDTLIADATAIADEIASMTQAYNKLPKDSYEKTNAYEAIQAKKAQYNDLETSYAEECGRRAARKINHVWARKFQRYVAAQNMTINDIFEQDNEETAKESIVKKLTYQKSEKNVVTGSTPQQVTSNMAQLQNTIETIILQFINNCGLGEYVKGNKRIPNAFAKPEEYKKFIASVAEPKNKSIEEDFKYVSRIYTILNTLIKNNEKDLAAIVFSYIKDFTYNNIPVFDVFNLAVERNCTPEQKQQMKDSRGKDIEFGRAAIANAMAALNDKLKEDIQGYTTASSLPSEDEEIEDETLEDINKIVVDALNFIKKP